MRGINLLSFVSLLFIALLGNAQSYSFVKSVDDVIWRMVPAEDGTFYTLTWLPNCPDDFIVVRYFNRMGDLVSAFKSPAYIGSLTSIEAVAKANNHLVLYLGDGDINHLLYEFDTNGTLIWNNNIQFTNPVIKFRKIISSPTGYYLLGNTYSASWGDSSQAIITKLSDVGKHVWTNHYGITPSSPASSHFNDILYDNNQLICVGRYYYDNQMVGQPPFRPTVSLLDTAGNVIQSYCYIVDSGMFTGFDYYEFMQISKTPGGHFYLVGNNFGNEHALFKMDSGFNLEWIREKLSGKSTAMCAGYNEDVFIAPDGEFSNFLMQFDGTGQMIGNHVTKNPASIYDLSYGHVMQLFRHDCGFLLSNQEDMYAHVDKSFAYCLDSTTSVYGNYYAVNTFYRRSANFVSGALTSFNEYIGLSPYTIVTSSIITHCTSTYNCTGTTSISEVNDEQIKIYPNPASSVLYMDLPEMYTNSNITLLDMNGRVLMSQFAGNGGMYEFNLAGLSAGVYILRIEHNKNVIVHKVEKLF